MHEPMEPEEIHRRVLWELVHEDAKPLPIIFEKLGQTGEVHTDWKRGNIAPIFKKGKKKITWETGSVVSHLCLAR